jgi:hypothetical protein
VILDDCFQVFSMLHSIELIVLHHELHDSLVSSDSVHNRLEIALELVAREINFSEVVVLADERLADDVGRLVAHALVLEAQAVLSLGQCHLRDESFSLLVRFARQPKVHALRLVELAPHVVRNGGLVLRNERFNYGVLAAEAAAARLLVRILLWLNLNGVLVENGPLALHFVNVLILLPGFICDVDVAALVGWRHLLRFALIGLRASNLALERPTFGACER